MKRPLWMILLAALAGSLASRAAQTKAGGPAERYAFAAPKVFRGGGFTPIR